MGWNTSEAQRSPGIKPGSQPQPAAGFLRYLRRILGRSAPRSTTKRPQVGELPLPTPTGNAKLPVEAPEHPGFCTSSRIAPRGNSRKDCAPREDGGATGDDDATPKASNGLEILPYACGVQLGSYYPPGTSLGIPSDRTPPSQTEPPVPSISKEVSSVCREFGAALAELKASHTDNNSSAIGKRLQDLYERMEPLKYSISPRTHFERPVVDSSADKHTAVVAASGTTRLSGVTAGAITPAGC